MKAVSVAGGSSDTSGAEGTAIPVAEPAAAGEEPTRTAPDPAEPAEAGPICPDNIGDITTQAPPTEAPASAEASTDPDEADPDGSGGTAAHDNETPDPDEAEPEPEAEAADPDNAAQTSPAEAPASDGNTTEQAGPSDEAVAAPEKAAEVRDTEDADAPDGSDTTDARTPAGPPDQASAEAAGPDTTSPETEADDAPEPDEDPEADEAQEPDAAPEADAAEPAGHGAQTAAREGQGVPSWARGGETETETDAERTSQSLALKELDTPAHAPAPVPAPAPTIKTPLPPLELLAELTNTPAPPDTPRRTVLRRVKVWTPILLLLAGAFTGAQLLRPLPAPQLVAAEPVHTLDGQFAIPWPAKGQGAVRIPGSGDIGTFGEQKPVPTASVGKVMTAYLILKNHPLRKGDPGPDIEVDAKAVAEGTAPHQSVIEWLNAGTKFSQLDMLKMLMLPSANNIARLLARWDTGSDSEAAFVAKMNAAARELGMKDTTYTDPSGLNADTVSTAVDQLKLAEAAMRDESFRAVVAAPSATIAGRTILNSNTLLTPGSTTGIKTGSSTPAGGTLMWAAEKPLGDETPLILGTLMDQHADGPDLDAVDSLDLVLKNSEKVIEGVRAALVSAPAVRKGQLVGYLDDGLGGRTPLVATRDLNVFGVPGQQMRLSLGPGSTRVPHAAKAGTEVGVLTVGDGDGAKSVPVAVRGDLTEPSFGTRVTRLG